MPKKRTLLSWSSGKDSAWSLYQLQQTKDIEVIGLVTTVNQAFDRVAMHAVRRQLLQQQAVVAGLPLYIIEIPYPCSNEDYASRMNQFINQAVAMETDCFAFGDLFLEDVRQYREGNLSTTGIKPLFPLWGIPTPKLAQDMIAAGIKAKLTCIDPNKLNDQLAGHEYNQTLLDLLPPTADPCGENGEFHTFVYDGPMFHQPIRIQTGTIKHRDGYIFTDLLPMDATPYPTK